MADNTETLGNFKIEVAVEGQQKVKSDLEGIKASLKGLKEELKRVSGEGKKLSDILKSLKSPNLNVGGGGTGGSKGGVFSQIAKEADSATKSISKFAQAVRDIKGDSKDLSRSFYKASSMLEGKVIGGVQRDASGAVTGRSGLTGVAYSIRSISNQLGGGVKGVGGFRNAMTEIVGESKRDPVTGKWTRTGSKELIHSFDSLSKAAKAAATNLSKVKAGGGAGGSGGQGSGVYRDSVLEKLLKSLGQSGNKFDTIARLLHYVNTGNSSIISKLSASSTLLGRVASAFGTGGAMGMVLGGASAAGVAVAAGSAIVNKQFEWAGKGSATIQDRWSRKKFMDRIGANYDTVNDYAASMRLSHVVLDENGMVDADKTEQAAQAAGMNSQRNVDTSWAKFRSEGVIAPWMTAFAKRGVSFTGLKTKEQMLEAAAKMKDRAGNSQFAKDQWLAFQADMGGFFSEGEWDAVSGGMEGLENYRSKSRALGGKGAYDKKTIEEAEKDFTKITDQSRENYQIQMRNTAMNADLALTKFTESLKDAKTALNNWAVSAKGIIASFQGELKYTGIYDPKFGERTIKRKNTVVDYATSAALGYIQGGVPVALKGSLALTHEEALKGKKIRGSGSSGLSNVEKSDVPTRRNPARRDRSARDAFDNLDKATRYIDNTRTIRTRPSAKTEEGMNVTFYITETSNAEDTAHQVEVALSRMLLRTANSVDVV